MKKRRTATKKLTTTKPRKTKTKIETYSAEDVEVYNLALLYEYRLMAYAKSTRKMWKTGISKRHKSWRYFKAALANCKAHQIHSEDFIEAQFWWFHQNATRMPLPHDLEHGVARAKAWLETYGDARSYYKPLKAQPESNIYTPTKDVQWDYYLSLIATWTKRFSCSEKELYAEFASMFPQEFLQTRPAWKELNVTSAA